MSSSAPTTRCLFRVTSVQDLEYNAVRPTAAGIELTDVKAQRIRLDTSYDTSGRNPEHTEFSAYTPVGHLEFQCDNANVIGTIHVGQEFYVELVPVKGAETAVAESPALTPAKEPAEAVRGEEEKGAGEFGALAAATAMPTEQYVAETQQEPAPAEIPADEEWLHKPEAAASLDRAVAHAQSTEPRQTSVEELTQLVGGETGSSSCSDAGSGSYGGSDAGGSCGGGDSGM